jgi:hypothetical protein
MTPTVLLKDGKNDGITVYVPKELKEMAAKIEYVKPAFIFYLVREPSDSTSYKTRP